MGMGTETGTARDGQGGAERDQEWRKGRQARAGKAAGSGDKRRQLAEDVLEYRESYKGEGVN